MGSRNEIMRYGVAILASLAAIGLWFVFQPFFVYSRTAFFFAAVAISAFYGGLGPGLLATVLSALGYALVLATYPPEQNPFLPDLLIPVGEFVVVSLLITYLNYSLRTAQRRSAQNLALLDTLTSTAPVGMAFLDRDFRFVRVNAALAGYADVPASEQIGRSVFEVWPALASWLTPILERVLATGEPVLDLEISGPPPVASEEERYWLASFYPVRLSRNEIQGIGSVFTEITDRKQSEVVHDQLIREQAARTATEFERARLQAILERAPSAIMVVDAVDGRLIANPVANQIFGHPLRPEDGRAQYANQWLYPDGRPVPFADLPSSRALRGEVVENEEFRILQPNGQRVPIRGSTAPIRGPSDEILGTVGVFQDVTAQKESERQREEWTSMIAHDLRQPVTAITGYVGLLLRESAPLPPSVVKKIEHVRASAQNLNRMIADLLDVSRIEADRLTLQCEMVSLPSLVQAVVERARDATVSHPVRVEVHRPVSEVMADPGRIEQVLTNLLSNAAKYGEPESSITVRIGQRVTEVEVSVLNRGRGIPPDEMPRLFQRFYRTPEARDGRVAGLGLGLYITKGLVEAHGGRIWAESIPGELTTFTFTLPIRGSTQSASEISP